MKNKLTFASLALTSALAVPLLVSSNAAATAPAPAAKMSRYSIDGGHSGALFRINHLGVSNFYGRFNSLEGSFAFDAEDLSNSEVKLSIDATSVDTNSENRDAHIMNPDFFDVKQFPKIEFTSTSAKVTAENRFDLTGDLTFHGVTKSVTAKVEYVGKGDTPMGARAGFEGTFEIERADFGLDWKLGSGMLGKTVRLTVFLEGVAQ